MWLRTPSPPRSFCRSDSFEGQSQWEWDGPSDEHWLPSTSAGILCLCRLITLQSSTGALRAVNYFAEQRGDVQSCERQRERQTEKRRLSRNHWELEWKKKRRCKDKRRGRESVGKVELRGRQEVRDTAERVEGWKVWVRGLPAILYNVASDSLYSRRQASTNEQSYKLITYREVRKRKMEKRGEVRDNWQQTASA